MKPFHFISILFAFLIITCPASTGSNETIDTVFLKQNSMFTDILIKFSGQEKFLVGDDPNKYKETARIYDFDYTLLADKKSTKKVYSTKKGQEKPFDDIVEKIINGNTLFNISTTEKSIEALDETPYQKYYYNFRNKTNPLPFIFPMLNFTEDQLTQIDVQKKDNSIWIYWKNTSNPLKDGDIFSLESEIDSNTLTAKRTVIVFNAFKRLPVIFYYGENFSIINNVVFPQKVNIGIWVQNSEELGKLDKAMQQISQSNTPKPSNKNSTDFILPYTLSIRLKDLNDFTSLPNVMQTLTLDIKDISINKNNFKPEDFWPAVKEGYRYLDNRNKYKEIRANASAASPEERKKISGTGPHIFE